MYGALYGACMVHVWCISTILYGVNRLLCVLDIVDEYCWDVWANSTRETLRYG